MTTSQSVPPRRQLSNSNRIDRERFTGRPRRVLVLGFGFLALFALTALFVPQQPLEIEQRWSEWMRDIQSSLLTDIALVFNALGRSVARAALLAAPTIILAVTRRWWALLAFALTEAATPLISSTAKALIDRPRLPDGLVHPAGASFPSGHAAFAAATSIAFVLLFTGVGPRRRIWWTLAALVIVTMAWSRTYLQVHWLLDVFGGSLLGAGVALVVFPTLQLLRASRPDGQGRSDRDLSQNLNA